MEKINKQQLLFFSSAFIGFLLFYSSYSSRQIELFTTQTNPGNFSKKTFQNISLFPETNFTHYLPGSERFIFQKMNNYKKLPPIKMTLPTTQPQKDFYLPPLPIAENIKTIAKESFIAVSEDIVVPDKSVFDRKNKNSKLSRLAQLLQKRVLKYDVVLMNNGKKFLGKIISDSKKGIIIHVSKNNKATNYELLRRQIQKVAKAIDIESVCKRELKKYKSLSVEQKIRLAQAFVELQQTALAEKLFERTIKDTPDENAFAHYIDYFLNKLAYEQAMHWLRKAHRAFPKSLKIQRIYAKELVRMNLSFDFLTVFGESQASEDLLFKAEHAIKHTNYSLALEQLNKIPESKDSSERVLYWRAYINYIRSDLAAAKELCSKITTSKLWSSKAKNLLGACLYLQGDLPKAHEILIENAKKGDHFSWYNLALVYMATSALAEAEEILNILRENTYVLSHEALCAKAYLSYINKDSSAATALAEEALQENPDSFLGHLVLAEIYYQEQQDSKAYEHYSKVLQKQFKFSPVLLRLAEITYRSNNLSDSSMYITELLKRQETLTANNAVKIYNLLARIYLEKQDSEAKSALQKSLKISPQNINTLKLSAILANKENDPNTAVLYLKKILELSTNDAFAQKYIRDIELTENSVYWEDTFSRKDSKEIRRGWFEEENSGIIIQLRSSQVFFSGTQRNNRTARILRSVPANKFLALRGEISTIAKAYLGIVLSDGRSLFYFGKDTDGQIGYASQNSDTVWDWKSIDEAKWPKELVVNIMVKRIPGRSKDSYELYINDDLVKTIEMRFRRDLQVGFFGKAEFGIAWSMHVDNAKIVEFKE